jgi:hypothetical protein
VMAQYKKCWRCVRYQTNTGCIGAVILGRTVESGRPWTTKQVWQHRGLISGMSVVQPYLSVIGSVVCCAACCTFPGLNLQGRQRRRWPSAESDICAVQG